jgi:tRNA modification GTPase
MISKVQATSLSSRLLETGGDTIVALATALGRSATAVIRMSGDSALEIAGRLTRRPLPAPRVSALRTLYGTAADSGPLDQCIVTVFPGPQSYSGEDIVEFSVHGGYLLPTLVLEQLIIAGAREALPGEFTRRAVLNGRLDLLQAEAVTDLVDSRSRGAASAALRQLDGGLTRRINELRSAILEIEALVAYDIDFPEEDDGPVAPVRVAEACERVIAQLTGLLATAGIGETLREGALVVIAGAPNTGKSSLFNALVGSSRALVTDVPGTTRDAIEAVVDADQWTLRLVDTAGLRDTDDVVERLGIEVAEDYLSAAQVVLVCGDNMSVLASAISRTRALSTAPMVAVLTKADLAGRQDDNAVQPLLAEHIGSANQTSAVCSVSALTGFGMAELLRSVTDALVQSHSVPEVGAPLLLRARHRRAVAEAKAEMEHFARAFTEGALPMPVAGTHLTAAAIALESLIGAVAVDDVLDRVFSSFCVGK